MAKRVRVLSRKSKYAAAGSATEGKPSLLESMIEEEEENEERRNQETRERHLLEQIVDDTEDPV